MPGHCLTDRGVRPHLGRYKSSDVTTPRFFLCARCRCQVAICRCCDRGQIYCAGDCAAEARREAQRAASKRYRMSRRGRFKQAERARRYRARQKIVTHEGSPPPPSGDLLPSTSTVTAKEPGPSDTIPWQTTLQRCHWCGRHCSPFVRQGFLPRRQVRQTVEYPKRS